MSMFDSSALWLQVSDISAINKAIVCILIYGDDSADHFRKTESPAWKLAYDELKYAITLEMKYKIVN